MDDELKIVKYGNGTIRVAKRDGKFWLSANDVGKALKLQNIYASTSGIPPEELSKIFMDREGRDMTFLSEKAISLFLERTRSGERDLFKAWSKNLFSGALVASDAEGKVIEIAEVSFMTTREIADIVGVSTRYLNRVAKMLFPGKSVQAVASKFTFEEVETIKKYMKVGNLGTDSSSQFSKSGNHAYKHLSPEEWKNLAQFAKSFNEGLLEDLEEAIAKRVLEGVSKVIMPPLYGGMAKLNNNQESARSEFQSLLSILPGTARSDYMQKKMEKQIKELVPHVPAPAETARAKVNRLVNAMAWHEGISIQVKYRQVYSQYEREYGVNVWKMTEGSKTSAIEYIENGGDMPKLLQIVEAMHQNLMEASIRKFEAVTAAQKPQGAPETSAKQITKRTRVSPQEEMFTPAECGPRREH